MLGIRLRACTHGSSVRSGGKKLRIQGSSCEARLGSAPEGPPDLVALVLRSQQLLPFCRGISMATHKQHLLEESGAGET